MKNLLILDRRMVLIVRTDLNLNKVQYKVFDRGVSSLIPFYKVKNSLIILSCNLLVGAAFWLMSY